MNNFHFVSHIPYVVGVGVALMVLPAILGKILVNVGAPGDGSKVVAK
jgi:hypothetical protein